MDEVMNKTKLCVQKNKIQLKIHASLSLDFLLMKQILSNYMKYNICVPYLLT